MMASYKEILVATDFTEHSEAAARRALELAKLCDARVQLLHVVEHFPEDVPSDVVAPEDVDPEAFVSQTFDDRLAAFARATGLGEACPRHVVLDSGSAKGSIVLAAERLGADLIVLGSHGRHGRSAWLGSTTDGVMHRAQCDVLTVR
jgi:universal stress protein A